MPHLEGTTVGSLTFNGHFPTPPGGIGVLVIILYVILCTALRFRQMRAMTNQFGYTTRASFAGMTVDDAYQIRKWLAEQEFPKVFSAPVFFALFRTYGVPSISRFLVQTGHLTYRGDGTKASKRAVGTSVLLTNMAVARTNYLHSQHLKKSRISGDDMLYALSLFVLEGMRWTDMCEWRRLTSMELSEERCAMATFWGALEITYSQFPSCTSGCRLCEARHVRPDDSNALLAESTINLALHNVPNMLKPLARQFIALLLGPRLREAMRIPHLSPVLRKGLLRRLFLPRPYFLRHRYIEEHIDPLIGPWSSWVTGGREGRISAGKFIPEGYLLPEVGPQEEIGRGLDKMENTVSLLASKDPHRGPFTTA
ncbi:hypothetical protein F5B21DRAFT_518916 [Xylaria acuta]|nr:hypothetical protein F5B21DRAFT_518916 [Xylaria acuta]